MLFFASSCIIHKTKRKLQNNGIMNITVKKRRLRPFLSVQKVYDALLFCILPHLIYLSNKSTTTLRNDGIASLLYLNFRALFFSKRFGTYPRTKSKQTSLTLLPKNNTIPALKFVFISHYFMARNSNTT